MVGLGVGSKTMEAKKTKKMSGFFDVKVYNAKLAREQWKNKGEDEAIIFGVTFSVCPEEFQKYAKEYQNKEGETRFAVKFKIGNKARWFNGAAKPVEKPTNDTLHGKRFDCSLVYAQLDGDPANKEASGYWVNAIQFAEHVDNPFTSWVAADEEPDMDFHPTTEQQPADDKGGLPF